MESVLISVESPNDRELLVALAKKMGFKTQALSVQETRWLARRALLETPLSEATSSNLTDSEIQAEVESVRQERYEKGHHARHR